MLRYARRANNAMRVKPTAPFLGAEGWPIWRLYAVGEEQIRPSTLSPSGEG